MGVINAEGQKIYQYLNFDKLDDYAAV
jgi:hypothetical protein